MSVEIGHHTDEERLDLTLEGNLDLTLASGLLRACELVDERIRTCVIDCTRVTRVFDSGLGLMLLLLDRLEAAGVALIMLGEIPGLRINPALFDDMPAAPAVGRVAVPSMAARARREGTLARAAAAS